MQLMTPALTILAGLAAIYQPLIFDPRWNSTQPPAQAPAFNDPVLSFESRWEPTERFPEMNEVPPWLGSKKVRIFRVIMEPMPVLAQAGTPPPLPRARPEPEPEPQTKARVRPDICQRHGMHRVDYGKRWRCRK